MQQLEFLDSSVSLSNGFQTHISLDSCIVQGW